MVLTKLKPDFFNGKTYFAPRLGVPSATAPFALVFSLKERSHETRKRCRNVCNQDHSSMICISYVYLDDFLMYISYFQVTSHNFSIIWDGYYG